MYSGWYNWFSTVKLNVSAFPIAITCMPRTMFSAAYAAIAPISSDSVVVCGPIFENGQHVGPAKWKSVCSTILLESLT